MCSDDYQGVCSVQKKGLLFPQLFHGDPYTLLFEPASEQNSCFGFLHRGEQIAGQRLLFCAVPGDCFCPLPRMLKIERVQQIRLLVLTDLNLHLSKAISKVACSDSYTLLFPSGASLLTFCS